jgi:hypothetical protein
MSSSAPQDEYKDLGNLSLLCFFITQKGKAPEIVAKADGQSLGNGFLDIQILSGVGNFTRWGDDSGSGADIDLTMFRPVVSSDYFFLGDIAIEGHRDSYTGSCYIVQARNDDPKNPCLKKPTKFVKVWDNHGSGSSRPNLAIWQPACDDPGYVAIGLIFGNTHTRIQDPPNPSDFLTLALVRRDLTVLVNCLPTLIWDDVGTQSSTNASLFPLPNSGYFICSLGAEGVVPSYQFPDLKKGGQSSD